MVPNLVSSGQIATLTSGTDLSAACPLPAPVLQTLPVPPPCPTHTHTGSHSCHFRASWPIPAASICIPLSGAFLSLPEHKGVGE